MVERLSALAVIKDIPCVWSDSHLSIFICLPSFRTRQAMQVSPPECCLVCVSCVLVCLLIQMRFATHAVLVVQMLLISYSFMYGANSIFWCFVVLFKH